MDNAPGCGRFPGCLLQFAVLDAVIVIAVAVLPDLKHAQGHAAGYFFNCHLFHLPSMSEYFPKLIFLGKLDIQAVGYFSLKPLSYAAE